MPSTRSSQKSMPAKAFAWSDVLSYLQSLVLDNWGMKLLALAIAFGLWFGVTEQRAPATIRLRSVPLVFSLPENAEISNNPRDDVDLTLSGSRQQLDNLNVRNLTVDVDIANLRAGDRVVRLTADSVKIELPTGVRIERIEPATIALRLEPIIERTLEVETRFEGQPAQGFSVRAMRALPETVRVRGVESHVKGLNKVVTESVLLDDKRESFTAREVTIDTTDSEVVSLDPTVTVEVRIEPNTNVTENPTTEQPSVEKKSPAKNTPINRP